MYIKNKVINDNSVNFEVSPIFSTSGLVNRCRKIVDDYFTFTNFDNYSQKYNFRKYCLSPNISNYVVQSIDIQELTYKNAPFNITVTRSGIITFEFPENMNNEDKEIFITRFERMIQYVM